jgi:hypothetical protein
LRPTASSKLRIACDTADWLMPSKSAAAVMPPFSATLAKISNVRKLTPAMLGALATSPADAPGGTSAGRAVGAPGALAGLSALPFARTISIHPSRPSADPNWRPLIAQIYFH